MTRKLPELLTGLAIIIIAGLFLMYALTQAQALGGSGYPLVAQFSNIGGLTVGADVKLGGVTIGHVTNEHLDPQTYAAIVTIQVDNNVKLPNDTSASINSDGLLGGNFVGLSPGGSDTMFKPGQSFGVTQSAVNIEDLLGKFIFSMGGDPGKSAAGSGANSGAASGAVSGPGGAAAPAANAAPGVAK